MTDQAKQILDMLVERTTNKDVTWQKTSGNNQYKMQFQNGAAITISYSQSGSLSVSQINYIASYIVYNDKGSVVEKVIASKSSPDFSQIKNLYDLVGRIERKEDETFTGIINELKANNSNSSRD